MIGLGPLIVFLVTVSIVVIYMLVVRSFLRQAETPVPSPEPEKKKEKQREPDKTTPGRLARTSPIVA